MTREYTKQVMVRLTSEQMAQLKALADETERTVAQTIRYAIRQYLGGTYVTVDRRDLPTTRDQFIQSLRDSGASEHVIQTAITSTEPTS